MICRLRKSKPWRWILLGFRLILGATFVYAGYLKIQDPQALGDSIATYEILPASLISVVVLGLPPLEIILGVWMISGIRLRYPAFGLLALTIIFAVAISQGILRGLNIDCGCFGGGTGTGSYPLIVLSRDIAIMIAAGILYADQILPNRSDQQ